MTQWRSSLPALAETLYMALEPMLPGVSVDALPEVDSTNSQLLNRARLGDVQPSVMLALQQTAGRGRNGKAWHSDEGASLMLSLGMLLNPADWSGLSLAAGVTVANALHPEITLKWPNDLWLHRGAQGRKLGGILIETASVPSTQGRWCVIGLGVNISRRSDADLRTPSACLHELTPHADLAWAATAVLPALASAVQRFECEGFAAFKTQFERRDALLGCLVSLSDGVAGNAQGVDHDGALLVHTAQGVRRITSDEVSVKPS